MNARCAPNHLVFADVALIPEYAGGRSVTADGAIDAIGRVWTGSRASTGLSLFGYGPFDDVAGNDLVLQLTTAAGRRLYVLPARTGALPANGPLDGVAVEPQATAGKTLYGQGVGDMDGDGFVDILLLRDPNGQGLVYFSWVRGGVPLAQTRSIVLTDAAWSDPPMRVCGIRWLRFDPPTAPGLFCDHDNSSPFSGTGAYALPTVFWPR